MGGGNPPNIPDSKSSPPETSTAKARVEEGPVMEVVVGATAAVVVQRLIETVEEISDMSEFRNAYRKLFSNLSRRVKLLVPMFEEIREGIEAGGREAAVAAAELGKLREAVELAKELLRFGSEASKICLVLERDKIMKRFQEVTVQLEQALGGISFDKFDVSDEVREQVELVHAQLRRAKERVDMPDAELYSDLLSIYNNSNDTDKDPAILKRLTEKLQLTTISDLKQESLALHEMVLASGGADPGENIEKMSMLLKKIKDYVQTQNPQMGTPMNVKGQSLNAKNKPTVIPDDFRCPISLELMKDPVIVSTGQTYERGFMEKWLGVGHDSCPKTQQRLSSKSLTPNYALRSLIAQWCVDNGLEPPKRPIDPRPSKAASERTKIDALLRQLTSPDIEDQRSAAGQLRLLAKRSADNRICIAEAGAIPLLVDLLCKQDARTQEHAVTALLNLSICEENKASIANSQAVSGIVHVLKNGSMEARENAAATFFSLSVVDENKVIIGMSGAIPALVQLLKEGSHRGKKDAATALFNLCIYQGNKGKAVRAGIITTLMGLVTMPTGGMVDESLAILSILASHPEGKVAIGAAEAVPVLVDVIGNGSPRNRENAAAVLVHLCAGEQQHQHLAEAHERGVMSFLRNLAQNGTDRGKRKAGLLIDRMNRFVKQQNLACAQVEAQVQAQARVQVLAQSQVPPEGSTSPEPSDKPQSSAPATSTD